MKKPNKILTINLGKGNIILNCKPKGVLLVTKSREKQPLGWIAAEVPLTETPLLQLNCGSKEAIDSLIGALNLIKEGL